ncbi:MAG: response regulator [Thermodesulfobacteriota bacterium]
MRILLVDDEEELVSALAERLTIRGIENEWFTRGSEALQRIDSGCFDVAVLDIKMPKIGGLELRKKLEDRCPDMKFIFLTGYGPEKDLTIETEIDGESDYLVKPVDISILINKIKGLFPDRRDDI